MDEPSINIAEDVAEADSKILNLLGKKKLSGAHESSEFDRLKKMERENLVKPREEYFEKYKTKLSNSLKGLSTDNERERDKIIEHFSLSEYDIAKIESGPVFDEKTIYNNLHNNMDEFRNIMSNLKHFEDINIVYLRKFVKSLIQNTGPNQNSSKLLINLLSPTIEDYFSIHSINVCIFTLIIALESSKIMHKKILTPEVSKNFNRTRICTLKTFTEEEMIDLGVASLLHDIYIKKRYPDLTIESSINFREHLEYKRHSIESFRISEKLNINRDMQLAILQHHEQLDGLGYPDGIHENVINRYAKVIALADRYESLTFVNPFTPVIGPIATISHLLKNEKTAFDGDLMMAFLKATSLFPLGSFVMLNSGELGIVTDINEQSMQKPKIKILFSKNNVQLTEPVIIDLYEYPDLKVEKAVHPREIRFMLPTITKQLNLI